MKIGHHHLLNVHSSMGWMVSLVEPLHSASPNHVRHTIPTYYCTYPCYLHSRLQCSCMQQDTHAVILGFLLQMSRSPQPFIRYRLVNKIRMSLASHQIGQIAVIFDIAIKRKPLNKCLMVVNIHR